MLNLILLFTSLGLCTPACGSGGKCEYKDGGFKCVCEEGYSGSTCDEGISVIINLL